MPLKVTAYKCRHCLVKMYNTEHVASLHEESCAANPSLKMCESCHNFDENSYCRVDMSSICGSKNHRSSCEHWAAIDENGIYETITQ